MEIPAPAKVESCFQQLEKVFQRLQNRHHYPDRVLLAALAAKVYQLAGDRYGQEGMPEVQSQKALAEGWGYADCLRQQGWDASRAACFFAGGIKGVADLFESGLPELQAGEEK
jgi:hypothetical protein